MSNIDYGVIQQIINAAWLHYSYIQDPAIRANEIYLYLYAQRNSGDSEIEASAEIAAAEHYFYARQLVSFEGYPVAEARVLVLGYDAFKRAKFAVQDSLIVERFAPVAFREWLKKLGRHDPNKPMTRPSDQLRTWGLSGCEAGEADRQISKFSPAPKWKKPPNYAGTRR